MPVTDAIPEPVPPVDLSNCEREPIHIPGAIQPHGALLALDTSRRRAARVMAAAGTERFTGRPAAEWLGADLAAVLDDPSARAVADQLERGDLAGVNPLPVRWRHPSLAAIALCDGILHRHDGLTLLELEPRREPAAHLFHAVQAALQRLQATGDLPAACEAMAREVRRLTGFDRVMIYRFGADWDGEVLAEDKADGMVGHLGHRFPASDIPAQARALYTQNPIRCIPDVNYTPAPIAVDRRRRPLDLSFSVLRSVSPIHLEYLRNMACATWPCRLRRRSRCCGRIGGSGA
jgi:light-regulated signal transduction histidine kinase (bacteriophytochrome)